MTIAFTLPGNIPIYVYSLLVGAAATAGLARMLQHPGSLMRQVMTGWLVLAAALAGARVGYLIIHPGLTLLQVPLGGLSWAGALAGGLAGAVLAAKLTGRPFIETADFLLPLAAALTIAGWLGCWVEGCAYGPVSEAWYALPAVDEWGNLADRIPVQALAALLGLVTYLSAEKLRTRPGRAAGAWLVLTGLQFWWLHGLRSDPAPLWLGIRPDLWASGAAAVIGLVFLLGASRARRSPTPLMETKSHEM